MNQPCHHMNSEVLRICYRMRDVLQIDFIDFVVVTNFDAVLSSFFRLLTVVRTLLIYV